MPTDTQVASAFKPLKKGIVKRAYRGTAAKMYKTVPTRKVWRRKTAYGKYPRRRVYGGYRSFRRRF